MEPAGLRFASDLRPAGSSAAPLGSANIERNDDGILENLKRTIDAAEGWQETGRYPSTKVAGIARCLPAENPDLHTSDELSKCVLLKAVAYKCHLANLGLE